MPKGLSVTTAAILLTMAWLLAYGGTITGGFIKDDFAWILHSRIDGWTSIYRAFAHADGFYRPMVQLSFGITEAIFGIDPVPYALTNIALALGSAAAIFALLVALGLPSWAALLGTATWAFNFHGINMAVAWLSGRTSLFGTLFSTLAVLALTRRRPVAAGVFCFAALLAKEEVLALPAIVTLWALIDRAPIRGTAPMWAALLVYLVLRDHSGAFGISNAPAFYRFQTDPAVIVKNFIEYTDRSLSLGVAVTAAALAVLGRLPLFSESLQRHVLKGLAWLVLGFALTLWLPVRSSLYVVFPSIGVAIITASVVAAAAASGVPLRAMRLAVAGVLLPFLLVPVYWQRNDRWMGPRALSSETFRAITATPLPNRTLVVLEDDLSTRDNFRNTFGTLFPEAATLHFGDDLQFWIDPPAPEVVGVLTRPESASVATFRLVNGRVERSPSQLAAVR